MTRIYLLFLFMLLCTACQVRDERPNVIVILTDDQGYGDVGYHGNPHIKTPTIDSLASRGIKLTHFYVSPRCAPTRAALMTGRYPEKTGVFHVTDGGYNMAEDELTMAEYFRQAGYRTAICGKWHIGDHYPYLPEDQGFDFALIHKGGAIGQLADHPENYWDMTIPLVQRRRCYFNTTLFRNREVYRAEGYVADVFTDHALEFIRGNRNRPFFLYLPYNTPHDPYQVPESYLQTYRDFPLQPEMDSSNGGSHRLSDYEAARYVYAMMTNMDDNLSRLVGLLKELELADHTIIVFLSDNGPARNRYNGHLRGKKGQVFEGGIRVPAFIHYAGLRGGKEVSFPFAHIDILPTLAELCHLPIQEDIDGTSMLPALEGKIPEMNDRPLIIRETGYMEPCRDMMIRKGDYKLIALGGQENPGFQLFNLRDDPFEQNDLSESEPGKAGDLKSELEDWYREVRHSENLGILPVVVGSRFENPVRLSRHELVASYSSGWFSRYYLGYYLIKVLHEGEYSVTLTFKDTITGPGMVKMKFGPAGRFREIENVPATRVEFNDIFMPAGEFVLETLYQNGEEVISPFYVEIKNNEIKP